MKKSLIYASLIMIGSFLVASCAEDEIDVKSSNESVSTGIRTPADALKIANDAVLLLGNPSTRATGRCASSLKNVQAIREFGTRAADSSFTSDTLMYIVNYDDEQGFAVVSANLETVDLLALTEKGSYYTFDNCEVEGFNDFMQLAKIYVQNPKIERGFDGPLHPIIPDTTYVYNIPPFLVTWGQTEPAGMYCPNGICGCVPLATAQILAYYGTPASINLTYSSADIMVQPLNWDSICLHRLTPPSYAPDPTLYCTASDSSHHAIGRLCRQLGNIMYSTYNSSSTSTSQNQIIPCFTALGYTCGNWTNYTSQCTQSSIMSNRQVYMVGSTDDEGHAWLVDGFMMRSYLDTMGLIGSDPQIIHEYYNHVNWGWNGKFNGYFADGVFAVSNYFSQDESPYLWISTPTYNFVYNLQYIVPVPNTIL